MELSKLIFIVVLIIIVLIFILFPDARALLKAFGHLFVKDMATTPSGAEAIYNTEINKAQDAYNKADDAYKRAAGKLSNAKKDLANSKTKLSKVESECEALVKAGKMDMAQLKSDERGEIKSDIERYETLIAAYEKATKAAKEAQEMCEHNLRSLKRESKEVVENMKVNEQLKDVYDDMDDIKNITSNDKMIGYIRDKNKDLDALVEGSRVVYENKTSTKLKRAEDEARKTQNDDYLESLKKKYNK